MRAGRRMAGASLYIDNEDGNTALARHGCDRRRHTQRSRHDHRHTRLPRARLAARHRRRTRRTHARARRRARPATAVPMRPDDAWMHGDDGFDRSAAASETHYFHCAPPCALDVPVGRPCITGPARLRVRAMAQTVDVVAGREARMRATLVPQRLAGGIRRLDQRRPARAHELRRPLPQHAGQPGPTGACRRSRCRLQPDRQQGRAHSGHRLVPHRRRSGQHAAQPRSCMRRNTTPASGAIWACCSWAITS